MGKIVLVASGKGGTGKTSVAANLGAALAKSGKLTVLVDMDIGLRNLDILLGLESGIVYDICDVTDGVCALDDALIKYGETENLYFLSSPQTKALAQLDAEIFEPVWERLKERFDYCIIDAPAGIDGGFLYSLNRADTVLIVTIPEISSLRDADRVISVVEDAGKNDIRLIINRIQPRLIESGVMMNVDDCADMLGIGVIGLIPEDYIPMSLNKKLAVFDERSRAGVAVTNISKRLMGENVPVMNFDEKQGFFIKLKQLIGRDKR